jgi:hypothetical protein
MLRPMALILGSLLTTATLAAQTPEIPNAHASDTAKARVSTRHVRGVAVGLDNRPVTPATPAVPATRATRATPATPGSGGRATPATPAVPATPATPAVPPTPPGKPASPGQSGSHRP